MGEEQKPLALKLEGKKSQRSDPDPYASVCLPLRAGQWLLRAPLWKLVSQHLTSITTKLGCFYSNQEENIEQAALSENYSPLQRNTAARKSILIKKQVDTNTINADYVLTIHTIVP